ncbi:hypothetical protein [uncultured Hydrogenophaga sp.]|uniref:hypothetical protein n=1 Tax=uncultured Hydrogenophaga sp. TaxID=199683 RepID=UPI0025827430|nr:hypothetical protein [uncultured Hydrogenophaga sp.]
MKIKVRQFLQHLSHEIEDEGQAAKYLDDSLPLIGLVVMYFNTVEKSLDSFICEVISDRTDAPGLIVIQKLMFNAKLDLFKRFAEDFHQTFSSEPPNFDKLVRELSEIARLRNLVVHADWNNTDEEGYTFIRLNGKKSGMLQEYVQFSVDSLEKLIDRMITANHALSDYWEWRSDCIANY